MYTYQDKQIESYHKKYIIDKTLETTERQSKLDNPEKLVTQGIQHDKVQSKTTKQYVLDTTIHKERQ